LLLYIVRQSLSGNAEDLSEQLIGERVFGRPVGYDPRDDNIVRSHASRLRQRLELYFDEEGRAEPLRVTIPRGTYVPSFDRVESQSPEFTQQANANADSTTDAQSSAVSTKSRSSKSKLLSWVGIFCGAVVALLLVLVWIHPFHPGKSRVALGSQGPTHELWSELFNSNIQTLIVPADASLVVLKVFTGHSVDVSEYANGRYLADVICEKPCDRTLLQTLAAHRYTSTADLKFAVALAHLPEALQNRTEIRYARDLQLDDLKHSNVVLLGTPEANPWTGLFQHQVNFVLQDDKAKGPLEIENRKPMPGEPSRYSYDLRDPSHGYATVAFLPNLSGLGNVLIVQGFSLADTEAAAELVTNREVFDRLFQQIMGSESTVPHFELLLRTMGINGISSPPSLLAYRIYR
jgi:hypothetical protein